ncbi:MAG: VWA domain-containing protein [Neisseriaceae bacterium]|nr:VWA domain-containing protein [Neisseriaceae bacterium]
MSVTRRLPVYLMIDTSGSMYGEPIEAIRTGLPSLLSALRNDPHASETVWLSIITFNCDAQQILPLTELFDVQLPDIDANGRTSLGAALELLVDCIERETEKSTAESKGDWRPFVFLFTDGEPTDDIRNGVNKVKSLKMGGVIACGVGASNTNILKQITESVVTLENADGASLAAYLKWVTQSIKMKSKNIDSSSSSSNVLETLAAPPPEINVVL